MRWRTELILYVGVFVLFGAVLVWVQDATWQTAAFAAVLALALVVLMGASLGRRRTVLVVGEGDPVERIDQALEGAGYEVRACAGPGNRPCPVLQGRSCPLEERPLAALIYRPRAGARFAPCGTALHVPAVIVEERPDVEAAVEGSFARVSLEGGTGGVIRTMERLIA